MAELPRPLPGFYYDHTLKRYFPVSSKRKVLALQSSTSDNEGQLKSPKRRAVDGALRLQPFRSLEGLLDRSEIERITHSYQARALCSLHLKYKDRLNLHPVSYAGEATCLAVTHDIHVAGASDGDLFTRRRSDTSASSQGPEHLGPWVLERSLHTMITSVAILNDLYFAASLGPAPRIAVTPLDRSGEGHTLSLPKAAQDVRTASFTSSGVALGCSGRLLFCSRADEIEFGLIHLSTRSDVVAVHQERNELFFGTRNGDVRLWDIRLPPSSAQQISARSTSVTHLRAIHEAQLLICLINGTVDLCDLRFLRSSRAVQQTPIMSLLGHQNSYTLGLGCCLSDDSDMLFLAGQDQCIRSWSLRTAEQQRVQSELRDNPLSSSFLHPIKAMSLSEGEGVVDLHAIDGYVSYVWG
ncbi:hypothetical protein CALVIDRAFT_103146 [Calocera viscosa TUFC12733]|uniref:WD40 repeat-like protein n=1 Tax=Calocera viscosa (strain TUFC12733) TaxID=1330018 RepID=A0A167MMV3_CALVF|nr:hypothetical protein CALVIDRAFT_103146 [Calocera viscosa TUFC12733]